MSRKSLTASAPVWPAGKSKGSSTERACRLEGQVVGGDPGEGVAGLATVDGAVELLQRRGRRG